MERTEAASAAALFAEKIRLPEWTKLELHEATRLLRRARLFGQEELARRTTFSQSAISQLENGRTDPRWSTIRCLWSALDCEPVVLPRPLSEWPRRPGFWRGPEWDD